MNFDYTVSCKDKGLTYIFLEQAKKQAGFDANKKINWQNVMSVFDEIQKEEQAEGQKLFRGGTDKTSAGWGKSYVIYAGDKISLSDEQMNKIYGAMGLDLSKITPSQPETPETPAQPPAAASSDQIPKKDENPPSAQTPPGKGADLSEASRPLDREFLVPHKQLAGKTVLREDGTSYTYDEKGYIKSVQNKNGNEICGDIHRSANGNVDYKDYEYDTNGNCTRVICRSTDGAVFWYNDCEYDTDGKMIREIQRNSDGTVSPCFMDFEYDINGNNTRVIYYFSDDGQVSYYFDNEYDTNGNITRSILRNSDGTVSQYTDYEYDANGEEINSITRNPDGSEKE